MTSYTYEEIAKKMCEHSFSPRTLGDVSIFLDRYCYGLKVDDVELAYILSAYNEIVDASNINQKSDTHEGVEDKKKGNKTGGGFINDLIEIADILSNFAVCTAYKSLDSGSCDELKEKIYRERKAVYAIRYISLFVIILEILLRVYMLVKCGSERKGDFKLAVLGLGLEIIPFIGFYYYFFKDKWAVTMSFLKDCSEHIKQKRTMFLWYESTFLSIFLWLFLVLGTFHRFSGDVEYKIYIGAMFFRVVYSGLVFMCPSEVFLPGQPVFRRFFGKYNYSANTVRPNIEHFYKDISIQEINENAKKRAFKVSLILGIIICSVAIIFGIRQLVNNRDENRRQVIENSYIAEGDEEEFINEPVLEEDDAVGETEVNNELYEILNNSIEVYKENDISMELEVAGKTYTLPADYSESIINDLGLPEDIFFDDYNEDGCVEPACEQYYAYWPDDDWYSLGVGIFNDSMETRHYTECDISGISVNAKAVQFNYRGVTQDSSWDDVILALGEDNIDNSDDPYWYERLIDDYIFIKFHFSDGEMEDAYFYLDVEGFALEQKVKNDNKQSQYSSEENVLPLEDSSPLCMTIDGNLYDLSMDDAGYVMEHYPVPQEHDEDDDIVEPGGYIHFRDNNSPIALDIVNYSDVPKHYTECSINEIIFYCNEIDLDFLNISSELSEEELLSIMGEPIYALQLSDPIYEWYICDSKYILRIMFRDGKMFYLNIRR